MLQKKPSRNIHYSSGFQVDNPDGETDVNVKRTFTSKSVRKMTQIRNGKKITKIETTYTDANGNKTVETEEIYDDGQGQQDKKESSSNNDVFKGLDDFSDMKSHWKNFGDFDDDFFKKNDMDKFGGFGGMGNNDFNNNNFQEEPQNNDDDEEPDYSNFGSDTMYNKESKPQNLDEFREAGLKAHNTYRQQHKVDDLTINPELNDYAQAYAEKLAANDSFQHSNCKWGSKRVGENLAMCGGMPMTGQYMSDMWYDEIKMYDFNGNGMSAGTGHFTQLVWKGSQQVGFGLATSKSGSNYAVANYYPAGNFVGRYQQNVLPKN